MSNKPADADDDEAPPTIEQWRQAAANLLRKGLIIETGEWRNGEPVYMAGAAPQGAALMARIPDAGLAVTPVSVNAMTDDEALTEIVMRRGVDHALEVIAAAEVAMAVAA